MPTCGRARSPGRLHAGATVRVPRHICAPSVPGLYQLQVHVVREGVSWAEPDVGLGGPAVKVAEATLDVPAPNSYLSYTFDDLITDE